MKPRIIIDNHIPFIKGAFDDSADVAYLAANEMTKDVVKDADALIIRTRTKCNEDLLEGSNVKIIATATIGTDHIDTEYCDKNNIKWSNAPGCNARSVGQWVGSAIAAWTKKNGTEAENMTLGIVGHGHVGKEVEKMGRLLGMKILLCDPILEKEMPLEYVDMQTIEERCDVITFHTPLTKDGEYATWHLGDKIFFDNLKKRPYIINAARGGVIDETELINALEKGTVCDCAIDCWEGEPKTNNRLREIALVATPHIAGYSADGKHNASQQSIKTVSKALGITPKEIESLDPQKEIKTERKYVADILLETYAIDKDTQILKENPELFEQHRGNYPVRREVKITISNK